MKVLAIGHSLVIDANRKFWSTFAHRNVCRVDLIVPSQWSSNLSAAINYRPSPITDKHLNLVLPVPVYFKGNGSLFFFHPLRTLEIFRREKYDAIYLNQETWALSTFWIILTKLLSRNASTPLYLCVAQNIRKEKYKVLWPYERLVAGFVRAFLFCSEGVKDVLRWKGIKQDAIYFPLPYDDEVYTIQPLAAAEEIRLGYLGRLSSDKGIELLLAVLDQLDAEGFKFRFIVGGNGPLVEELKRRSYVDYRGLIPHSMAQTFYNDIDCFILPSQTRPNWKEQFGRVIVESFAAGKPVIGSDSGSIPEVLAKLHWNWTFKEDSASELKDAILRMKDYLKTEEGKRALLESVALNQRLFSQSAVSKYLFTELQRHSSP